MLHTWVGLVLLGATLGTMLCFAMVESMVFAAIGWEETEQEWNHVYGPTTDWWVELQMELIAVDLGEVAIANNSVLRSELAEAALVVVYVGGAR